MIQPSYPKVYKGFAIKQEKVEGRYKLSAFSFTDNITLRPLYNDFNQIKTTIDKFKF